MNFPEIPRFIRPGLAILSGALLALSYPRFDLFPLAFIALVPLLLAVGESRFRKAFGLGLLAGGAFFAILLYWLVPVMERFGGLSRFAAIASLSLLVVYLAAFIGAFAAIAAHWRRHHGPAGLLIAPIAWVALELLRARAFGGFPWGLLGYSQSENLPLLQSAALGSVYLVSLLVAACNVAITALILGTVRGARRTILAPAVILTLVLLAHLAGAVVLVRGTTAGEGVRIALVQGNVAQERKWRGGAEEEIVGDLMTMTRRAAAAGARIVLWPESSSPFSFRQPVAARGGEVPAVVERTGFADRVVALVQELDIELIAGSVDYRVEEGRVLALNSAFRIGADGTLGPTYDKVRLVPFGEYVPFGPLLFFVNPLVEGAIAEFEPGRRYDPLPTRAGPAATVICYEAIFPRVVTRIGRGASFLVNITNDAWFGRSAGPYQHLAMARVRAVELRRDLARAANTGISALIDPYGRIVERTRLEESALLLGRIHPRSGLTLCARLSDGGAWACAILTVLILMRGLFRRRGSNLQPGHVTS
ncbi:MAG: apolipoprotein N-acyltransferase [Acidobacteriota bacterium]